MASKLLGSFAVASSGTAVASCLRSKKCAKSYYASSYSTKASRYKTEKIQNEYLIVRHQQHNLKHRYRGIETASIFEECARSYVVNAGPGEIFESESQNPTKKSFWSSIKYSLDAFCRFIKPYVLIGTAISIISMSLLALEKSSDISPTFFIALFQAIVAAAFMNAYISGLNQLTDIEIDKADVFTTVQHPRDIRGINTDTINKPYRPLASGEYSIRTGVIITASCLIMSFGLGWIVGSPPLLWALFIHFIFGTAYSIDLPLLRWRRFAVLAAMCIVAVQGITFQLAYFLHMQTYAFKRLVILPRSLIFATTFMGFFSLILALFKDIPDTEGDKKEGIQSLSICLGQKRVFWICVSLLEIAYGAALIVGATSSCLWSKLFMVLGHGFLALILWYRAKSVDLESNFAIESFYMFLWQLFYAEYFIYL